MSVNNNAKLIRRDILRRLTEIMVKDSDKSEIDRIPIEMRPRGGDHVRCCIYKDRAVIKYKIMGMMGIIPDENEDELKPLSGYFYEQKNKKTEAGNILNVVDEACSSCQKVNYVVTNMCRGCVGRSCMLSCPKNAVHFEGERAVIDPDKCVNCGLCAKACPFHAIIHSPVPCEEVCPVGAIEKDEDGKERINPDLCTLCGKCMETCPFGAIVEKTQLFEIVQEIKDNKEVIAMVAPSLAGQFRESMGKILTGVKKLGFDKVYEVAEGADMTSLNEALELKEKTAAGEHLATSCCPAWVNLAKKHQPDFLKYISSTPSPMEYTGRLLRGKYPHAQLVFIGPCIAKKDEGLQSENVDYVINYEELGSWLIASGIELSDQKEMEIKDSISPDARNYAQAGGVTQAVAEQLPGTEINSVSFDGVDKSFIREFRKVLKSKDPQMIEVMSCPGGCIGGCSSVTNPGLAKRQLKKFVDSTQKTEIKK